MVTLFISLVLSFSTVWAAGANSPAVQKVVNELRANTAKSEKYTVFLYGDPQVYHRFRAGSDIRNLEKAFGNPVIAYAIDNAADFYEVMGLLSKNRVPIAALITKGLHGGTYENIPSFEIVDVGHNDFENVGFNDLERLGVKLNFTADAFLHFNSCDMIEQNTVKSISIAFNEVKRIGFKTGWIYLNQEFGWEATANNFAVPFYKHEGDWKKKARGAFFQLVGWPVVLPGYYIAGRYYFNHGYLWGESATHKVILKTHAFDVELGELKGDLIYSR